jgi:transcriptional regulator with GAF, ATPase, and Fis domain
VSNPRLLAISGLLKGTVWAMKDGPLLIGRDPANQVTMNEAGVSRRHCSLSEVYSGFEITDLESHNGTILNGKKISREALRHRDRIRIGSCEYLFLTEPEDEAAVLSYLSASLEASRFRTMPLDRTGLPSLDSGVARMARDLTAFFKIANVINSTRDAQALQQELLTLISEVIPAANGAILLHSNLQEERKAQCFWNREGAAERDMRIHDELVQRATWDRCAVFSSLPAETAATEHVLCVPLLGVERILGVIYLSSPASSAAFTEQHAYFVSSVSRIAAVTLENLSRLDSIQSENQRLRVEAKGGNSLIGKSSAMLRVSDFITRVARGNSTVLIRGESGTGKELVARAIHGKGERANEPFVAINCAAIPEALLESELFGHEKGAFTGAIAARKGKFEVSGEGTLFLDEIGDMDLPLQTKLLRVLQEREFERVGASRSLPFKARIVAATHKNLEQAIKAGEFRQDLYYRLNVVSIAMPPLREHREDIPLLALHFARKYAAKGKRGFKGIAAEARSVLMQYSWPGNVRELENAIEHAIVMGLTEEILLEDLPNPLLEEQSVELTARYHDALNQTKKQLVLSALDEANGSPVEAARLLGIHPKYLHRLIRNLNLKSGLKGQG